MALLELFVFDCALADCCAVDVDVLCDAVECCAPAELLADDDFLRLDDLDDDDDMDFVAVDAVDVLGFVCVAGFFVFK